MKGRQAHSPAGMDFPAWKSILYRSFKNAQANQIPLIAAGIAFYSLLSIFPSIAAAVSIWGLFADAAYISETISRLGSILPASALQLIETQARELAGRGTQSLGFSLVLSVTLVLFGASRSVKAFIIALNNIYREDESRNIVILSLFAFVLTLGLLLTLLVMVAAVIVSPNLLEWIGLSDTDIYIYQIVRWSVLIGFATLAVSILYRYGPARRAAKWRWITGGAFLATLLWIGLTAVFSWYVSHFATYNETYGLLGAVVILLMWLWLSALAVLGGAILDAEVEHQTEVDTTKSKPRPMGRRGAYVADHAGQLVGPEGLEPPTKPL